MEELEPAFLVALSPEAEGRLVPVLGLHEPHPLRGQVPGGQRVSAGLLRHLGPSVMLRKHLEVCRVVPDLGLQRFRHVPVELSPLPEEERVVRDLLDQRVLERPPAGLLLHEQLGSYQGVQLRADVPGPHDGLEQVRREVATDHCGVLKHAPRLGVQPIDPGQDRALDRIGDLHLEAGQDGLPVHHRKRAQLEEGLEELLHEEGVALGPLPHDALEVGRKIGHAEVAAGQYHALLRRERLQPDGGMAGPKGGSLDLVESGPVRQDEHQR